MNGTFYRSGYCDDKWCNGNFGVGISSSSTTHAFVTVINCGCDGDDKLKLTKFDIVFELVIVFMKHKLCLGPGKHSLSARSSVIRVTSEPAYSSA